MFKSAKRELRNGSTRDATSRNGSSHNGSSHIGSSNNGSSHSAVGHLFQGPLVATGQAGLSAHPTASQPVTSRLASAQAVPAQSLAGGLASAPSRQQVNRAVSANPVPVNSLVPNPASANGSGPHSAGSGRDSRSTFVPADFAINDHGIYKRYGKRVLDLVASSGMLLLLLPFFPLVALAIRLSSPGPILYRSTRLGKNGKAFTFLKFRSMVVDAHENRRHLLHLNEVDGPVFKLSNDPRVTRVGSFLRRTSIDELPQLINVLRGEMSLVGPRPPIPEEVEKYEPWQRRRLEVTPGITCLWQISGRSRLGFNEWMRLDLQYIQHRSLRLDLKILLRTLPAVLSRDGAY